MRLFPFSAECGHSERNGYYRFCSEKEGRNIQAAIRTTEEVLFHESSGENTAGFPAWRAQKEEEKGRIEMNVTYCNCLLYTSGTGVAGGVGGVGIAGPGHEQLAVFGPVHIAAVRNAGPAHVVLRVAELPQSFVVGEFPGRFRGSEKEMCIRDRPD